MTTKFRAKLRTQIQIQNHQGSKPGRKTRIRTDRRSKTLRTSTRKISTHNNSK